MSRRKGPRPAVATPGNLVTSGLALAGAALQLVSRLRDHIERLDDGVVYAADDLAVVLRALVCPGDGNRVLMRLYDSTKLSVPSVLLSAPVSADPDVFFAVGAMPTEEPGAKADGAVEVSLHKWMNTRMLVVKGAGSRESYTWASFLNTYANKWGGAHLAEVVPPHLQMIDHHVAGGMPLSHYLLRTAGVKVWHLAQEAFRDVLFEQRPVTPGEVITSEQRATAIYAAPGGLSSEPRDVSNLGQLQVFCHRSAGAELIFYVDSQSPDNALQLRLGELPFDIRYSAPDVPATSGAVTPRAARTPIAKSHITVGSTKQIPFNGVIKTLEQVRASTQD